jgi:ariadne-1
MEEDNSDYEYEMENEEDYKYEEEDADFFAEQDESRLSEAAMSATSSKPRDSILRVSRAGSMETKVLMGIPCDGYIVKSQEEIMPLMNNLIDEAAGLLGVSEDEAQILLQNNKWNKEKLLESFFADSEACAKAAGIDLFDSNVLDKLRRYPEERESAKEGIFRCKIRFCCEEECPVREAFALGCGHRFCRACYQEYLRNQVLDGPGCIAARCPEHKCNQVIPASVYRHFLQGLPEAAKFESFCLRQFVDTSKAMRYCPAPRCEKVIVGSGVTSVTCSCGMALCFKCGDSSHDPCSCTQLAEWTEKCMNESETANWIIANTRKCPVCTTRIEKNQGCNHMNCRVCKHEFCWICMGAWSEHGQNTGGFYKCNRFDPAELPATVSEQQRAKAELDRYLHYYQRYHGHDQGLQFAEKLREQSERRMLEQQESQRSSWMDVQFLKQAAEQVRDCRRVLKYTYVLGYFLKDKTPEKILFEHHQEMLEKNTERLQEFTEMPLDQLNRADVVNLTRVTERFMAGLLASMSGGVVIMDEATRQMTSTVAGVSST